MSKNKTVYTIFGGHFIENSDIHFLYINAKNPFTKDNHFVVQTVNGSHSEVENKFSGLDDLGNKDCAYEYWIEIYGHNMDDMFDKGQNYDPNDGLPF